MDEETQDLILIMGLDRWSVELVDGPKMYVYAFAYSLQDDNYIFTGLARGTPNRLVELARVPARIVRAVRGPLGAQC